MTIKKFIKKILKLKGLKVEFERLRERERRLDLWVKPYKNGCCCPQCERRGKIVNLDTVEREWRDMTFGAYQVIFHYCPKEIECATHGRIQEKIPWADDYARITFRCEFQLLLFCQIMTQKAAAQLLKMAKSTLSDLLHRCIQRLRDGHRIRGLEFMGVDEIAYCKGKKYATVVYDMEQSCVVWVGKGKGKETLDRFFKKALTEFQRKQIKIVTSDMSRSYLSSIREYCINAKLVLDKFHIAKALNEAVDEVRKEKYRTLTKEERKVFKGIRWLLFKHTQNRTHHENQVLKALEKNNRAIYRASKLKDEFELFWECSHYNEAFDFLKGWTRSALLSRLEPLRQFARTIRNHFNDVLNYIETHVTNAAAEGLNRIIKMIKNRASGFANLESFSDLIYLQVGDLNLLNQIPKKFHAL